jgi:hypothetical protein
MHLLRPMTLPALVATCALAQGQGPFKAEVVTESPPTALSIAIRGELSDRAYKVLDGRGRPFAEIWLRKATPASARPAGPDGRVQFPGLADGTLLGALRYSGEGQDFRDQTIAPGVYTLRYGRQPGNGAHTRVSPYRDFALLLPASDDTRVPALERKALEEKSADAAGSTHPAVLTLLAADAKAPRVVEDRAQKTWGVVVPLSLAVRGETSPVEMHVRIVVAGSVAAF